MARPIKQGLNYFPVDVDMMEDPKVELVSAKYGLRSEAIIMRLLYKIYRNGYFIEWNEDIALLFLKRLNGEIQIEYLNDVINELIKRNFFDKILFQKYGVLTSHGIQKRYIKAWRDSKRKTIDIEPHLNLLRINSEETPNIPEETPNIPEDISHKGEEIKEKKIKGKDSTVPSLDEVLLYATQAQIPEESAKGYFYHYQSAGWVTAGAVQRHFEWRSKLQQWYLNEVKQFSGNNGKSKDKEKIMEFRTA